MTRKQKKFSWNDGARISIDPQAAGEEIERLKLETADALLVAAKPRSSPLHDAFDWDNETAAHQHRLSTARLLLRSLRYEYRHVPNGDPEPRRYIIAIKDNPKEERYVTTARIMTEKELYDKVVKQLKEELLSFARRNAEFRGDKALRNVFEAIEKLA